MSPRDPAADRLIALRADVRYARERRDLYRAKSYGPRATSPTRMRELERELELASERLQAAEAASAGSAPS